MTNPTTAAAPLTRRQAREIERTTGTRPLAAVVPVAPTALTRRALREQRRAEEAAAAQARGLAFAAAPAIVDHRHDTGEIERNELTALVSVLPAELRAAVGAADEAERPLAPVVLLRADGAPRGVSLRAAVPASLAAARRRRAVGGFAAAASLAAVATTGVATLGSGQVAEAQHQASLATASAPQTVVVPDDAELGAVETAAPAEVAAAPAAEVAAVEGATTIERVGADALAAAGVEVEPVETASQSTSSSSIAAAAAAPSISSPVAPGATFSSAYGYRSAPIAGAKAFHDGIDLSGSCGLPLYAVTSGTITATGWDGTYGERLDLASNDGSTSFMYAHLQGYAVSPGEQVAAGDLIGYLGTTGLSTGCHLHFEVTVDGGNVDPQAWLADRGIHV